VLNFRDHDFLKTTNVLNPDWVTQGIYALLSDDRLKTEGKGILTEDDLGRVLNQQRYPADRHRYLTELMQEFQLCFALPDCPSPKFLIPGLLPKDEPDNISLKGDTLDFQYHYRILPEGVLSRFIVLSHEKIHAKPAGVVASCWPTARATKPTTSPASKPTRKTKNLHRRQWSRNHPPGLSLPDPRHLCQNPQQLCRSRSYRMGACARPS
jgi:GTPase SAR1 family protein